MGAMLFRQARRAVEGAWPRMPGMPMAGGKDDGGWRNQGIAARGRSYEQGRFAVMRGGVRFLWERPKHHAFDAVARIVRGSGSTKASRSGTASTRGRTHTAFVHRDS